MIQTGSIGNKFEFICVAGERCKQLQHGARARIETAALKPATVAMQEVLAGVIEYSYGPFPTEYQPEAEVGEVTTEAFPMESAALETGEQG
jgi:DNA-directed RNA polymerase subunit K/omega